MVQKRAGPDVAGHETRSRQTESREFVAQLDFVVVYNVQFCVRDVPLYQSCRDFFHKGFLT